MTSPCECSAACLTPTRSSTALVADGTAESNPYHSGRLRQHDAGTAVERLVPRTNQLVGVGGTQ